MMGVGDMSFKSFGNKPQWFPSMGKIKRALKRLFHKHPLPLEKISGFGELECDPE